MTDPTTYTVTRTDGEGPWHIRENGAETERVPGHYDVDEVLRIVEADTGLTLAWQILPDGFAGTVPVDPARPLTHTQADTLRTRAQQAILAAHKRGYALAQDHLTQPDDAATLAAYTVANAAVMDTISGLEVQP